MVVQITSMDTSCAPGTSILCAVLRLAVGNFIMAEFNRVCALTANFSSYDLALRCHLRTAMIPVVCPHRRAAHGYVHDMFSFFLGLQFV